VSSDAYPSVTISTSKRYVFGSVQSEGVVGAGGVGVGGVGVGGVGVGGVSVVEPQKLGLGALWSLQMVSLIHAHCDSGKLLEILLDQHERTRMNLL